MASAKSRKCEATNDTECLPKFGRIVTCCRAEHSAEFFGRTSASAELRPISCIGRLHGISLALHINTAAEKINGQHKKVSITAEDIYKRDEESMWQVNGQYLTQFVLQQWQWHDCKASVQLMHWCWHRYTDSDRCGGVPAEICTLNHLAKCTFTECLYHLVCNAHHRTSTHDEWQLTHAVEHSFSTPDTSYYNVFHQTRTSWHFIAITFHRVK